MLAARRISARQFRCFSSSKLVLWNLAEYRKHVQERESIGVVPLPLAAEQVADLVKLVENPPKGDEATVLDLLSNRVPAGVDPAAYVKAAFLTAVAKGTTKSPLITKKQAVQLLGQMIGGYNIATLIELLEDKELASDAAEQLKMSTLLFDYFSDVAEKAKAGNKFADAVLKSWAEGDWFTKRPKVAEKISVLVFKVSGEINTDDLSTAVDAWSRPDIPLHAKAMFKMPREGITNAEKQIMELKKLGHAVAFVGTGSSQKSATNSFLWYIGDSIPGVPNKNQGGICIGGKITPIFYNTMEDAGALPFECEVSNLQTGDVIDIFPYKGVINNNKTGQLVSNFSLKSEVLLDEVQAGGRINLIIGRSLTSKAREALHLPPSKLFRLPETPKVTGKEFSLAQKMVGAVCAVEGIGEPKMTTVADLVMQSFCHTAAYPKPVDVISHHSLPDFIRTRGGVSLRPGDGTIHSWLNKMLLPDAVGTGGDSHTRFPLGQIRFLSPHYQTRHYQAFADPTYDATFKMIFGNEQHKELLISLINNLLDFKNEQEVKEIQIITTEIPIGYVSNLKTAIDIRCKTSDGREILVEIQRNYKDYFLSRSQYYVAKVMSVQPEVGQSAFYHTMYCIPVYVLAISRGTLFRLEKDDSFEKTVVPTIKECDHVEFPGNKMHWKYFELSKFEKKYEKVTINKSHPVKLQWLDFLNKCAIKQEIPEVDGLVQEAYKIMERAKWSKEKTEAFDLLVIKEKFEEGEQEKHFQEARTEGRTEGRAEGRTEGKIETAKKLLLLTDMTEQEISTCTGLSLTQIRHLHQLT